MNTKVLKTLEYNKIIEQLVSKTSSKMGKELSSSLVPYCDLATINNKQKETSQAATMILRRGSLALGGLKDIRASIKRLFIGGDLSQIELLNIGELLRVAKQVKAYAKSAKDTNTANNLDIIYGLFDAIELINPLYKEITRCIISEEEISDDASRELYNIRRQMKISNGKIKEHLNKIITSSTYKTMLQDPIITLRNDRYCVPVKQEYRGSFRGMIHDQSASGSTLFIEPISVVELNNKIKELFTKEKQEIEKILADLSSMCFIQKEELASNMKILTEIDFIFAKGELSIALNGTEPIFNDDKYINIKKGRHPLLDKNTVVPIDIHLGKDFTTLMITGPNTGGKTVTLKTVGLLTLMGQAGLHIPAFDKSQLTIFDDIFADIGDEQSIEQSLSTFSSHMTNIIDILQNATDNSLVLFDELGAGTDPTEGAALANAILENLHSKNVLTIATTHYSELKVYALSTEGVENACCEFDVNSLRPTYRLLIGIPGKSNAFAISKRLGLTDNIIEEAKQLLEHKEIRFEDLITELEISKKTTLLEKEKALRYSREAEELKNKVDVQRDKIQKQKDKLINEAKEEAYKILNNAKDEADNIIKSMNKLRTNTDNSKEMEIHRSKLRSSISSLEKDLSTGIKRRKTTTKSPKDLKQGDTVFVSTFNQKGTVLQPPNSKGDVLVQLGIMKTKVNIKNLSYVKSNEIDYKTKVPKTKNNISSKSMSISPEIDVRGRNVDEAIGELDKFLDDAYLSHLPQITIIHGKGTGVLRAGIHTFLKRVKYVKTYRIGNYGEGDSGVTIVEFK
ncbi:endonuclease MutS2 [Vallitalea longa]|uniref:Endonuclease MutS2 n=1 Tax=Vallitalea longa TaxID=2936439 RepID=A0A9W5YFI7_9FIRM|nr:endonuclease MutS2 [Vallitalea longa]GKX32114.1 endonuclease MutS2 [Vallitalea longa]